MKTALLRVTVADDVEAPIHLVVDAVERFAGSTYPVINGKYLTDDDRAYYANGIVIEEVTA